jgi:hypothetical protein
MQTLLNFDEKLPTILIKRIGLKNRKWRIERVNQPGRTDVTRQTAFDNLRSKPGAPHARATIIF